MNQNNINLHDIWMLIDDISQHHLQVFNLSFYFDAGLLEFIRSQSFSRNLAQSL